MSISITFDQVFVIPGLGNDFTGYNNGDNKYLVKRNGNTHLVRGRGTYPPDSIVEVMLPDGEWNRAFIVY